MEEKPHFSRVKTMEEKEETGHRWMNRQYTRRSVGVLGTLREASSE
jgi:hypothetical protein